MTFTQIESELIMEMIELSWSITLMSISGMAVLPVSQNTNSSLASKRFFLTLKNELLI